VENKGAAENLKNLWYLYKGVTFTNDNHAKRNWFCSLSNTCSLIATLLNSFGLLFISHLEFKHLLDFLICLALGALALVQS
jgi:hypothetical protein